MAVGSQGQAPKAPPEGGTPHATVQNEGEKRRLVQHISHPVASVGQRFWALVIDLIIVSVVTLIIWLVFSLLTLRFASFELFASGTLGLSILYFILFESMDGQTIGKKVLRIKVVSAESMKKPDLAAVILRNVLRLVDSFPPNFYIVGFIVAILNERHQRVGDLIARTIVVKEEERMD